MEWYFWPLWLIVAVPAVLEAIAVYQGKSNRRPTVQVRLISVLVWEAIARYRSFTPLFFSFWAIVLPHFYLPPHRPRQWTTPEGWAILVVGVITIWLIELRRRAMASERTVGQVVKEEPLVTKFLAGSGLVGVVVVLLKKFTDVDVDEATLSAVFVFIGALVTAWQRRSVTSMAKVDRLEEGGKLEAGSADAIRQPPGPPGGAPKPPEPQPFPRAN